MHFLVQICLGNPKATLRQRCQSMAKGGQYFDDLWNKIAMITGSSKLPRVSSMLPCHVTRSIYPLVIAMQNGNVQWVNHLKVYGRKFRSQTSDNMDRWKAEMGRVREEKRREEERRSKRERVRRKKIQVREKVGNSRNTVFCQWFVAPEDRKVGLLKRRVRRHVVRWDMKSCTPWWREAHFQFKSAKNWGARNTFGRSDPVSRGRHKGLCTLSKVSKTWGFCSSFKKRWQVWDICKGYDWQLQQQLLPQLQVHLHYTTLITLQHTATYYNYKYNYNCNHTTLHLHYTDYIALRRYNYSCSCNCNYNYHYITLHCTTLHYTYYTTRHYTALR